MAGGVEKFGHFEIARGAQGQLVELPRSSDELVFLAFDIRLLRLVELHVLKGGNPLTATEKALFEEHMQAARELRRAGFLRILEHGEDDDMVYYSSGLLDGEPLEDYVKRRGPLPLTTALSLGLHLLEDLVRLEPYPSLLAGMRIDKAVVSLVEEVYLQLRLYDFGLARLASEEKPEVAARRLVVEFSRVMFMLLIGRPPEKGENCDQHAVIKKGLPGGLRTMMRHSLGKGDPDPQPPSWMRNQVRSALMAQTRDIQGRHARRNLTAAESMLPESGLRKVLLRELPLEEMLSGRMEMEESSPRRYPFTVMGTDVRTRASIAAHLLPPSRVVAPGHHDSVTQQLWRFHSDRHPNILRSTGVWVTPDLNFLVEERGPGYPLSRLMAERGFLNPVEVLLILRQVKAGIEQATGCGMEKVDLHPANMFLRVCGTPAAREVEKLLQKQLDAWPKFLVMLRPHVTMRALHEPPLVEMGADEDMGERALSRDYRNRSYVALAAYLLSGERPKPGEMELPDCLPPPVAQFISRNVELGLQSDQTPEPEDFLADFERLVAPPEAVTEKQPEISVRKKTPVVIRLNGSSGATILPPLAKVTVAPLPRIVPVAGIVDSVDLPAGPLTTPEPAAQSFAAPQPVESPAAEGPVSISEPLPVESAGLVSDYPEDNLPPPDAEAPDRALVGMDASPAPTGQGLFSTRFPMVIGAAGLALVLVMFYAFFFHSGNADEGMPRDEAAPPSPSVARVEEPPVAAPVAAAPTPPSPSSPTPAPVPLPPQEPKTVLVPVPAPPPALVVPVSLPTPTVPRSEEVRRAVLPSDSELRAMKDGTEEPKELEVEQVSR